jgi:hypothetical protein
VPSLTQLPYVSPMYYDRFLQMLKVEDIVMLFTLLLSEEKSILIVCREKFDFIPVVLSLMSLMHPFEWPFPVIPFVTSDPNNPNKD